MKSSASQPAARGYANASLTDKTKNLPMETLYEKIVAASPSERTAAIRLLFISLTDSIEKERFLDMLLTLLPDEKNFYTKIEIVPHWKTAGTQQPKKRAVKIHNNIRGFKETTPDKRSVYPGLFLFGGAGESRTRVRKTITKAFSERS